MGWPAQMALQDGRAGTEGITYLTSGPVWDPVGPGPGFTDGFGAGTLPGITGPVGTMASAISEALGHSPAVLGLSDGLR